jgi:hypothetical protein
MRVAVKMTNRKPRTARSMGLSDEEVAKMLGIRLERLVNALDEAGLCRCPRRSGAMSMSEEGDTGFGPVGHRREDSVPSTSGGPDSAR